MIGKWGFWNEGAQMWVRAYQFGGVLLYDYKSQAEAHEYYSGWACLEVRQYFL